MPRGTPLSKKLTPPEGPFPIDEKVLHAAYSNPKYYNVRRVNARGRSLKSTSASTPTSTLASALASASTSTLASRLSSVSIGPRVSIRTSTCVGPYAFDVKTMRSLFKDKALLFSTLPRDILIYCIWPLLFQEKTVGNGDELSTHTLYTCGTGIKVGLEFLQVGTTTITQLWEGGVVVQRTTTTAPTEDCVAKTTTQYLDPHKVAKDYTDENGVIGTLTHFIRKNGLAVTIKTRIHNKITTTIKQVYDEDLLVRKKTTIGRDTTCVSYVHTADTVTTILHEHDSSRTVLTATIVYVSLADALAQRNGMATGAARCYSRNSNSDISSTFSANYTSAASSDVFSGTSDIKYSRPYAYSDWVRDIRAGTHMHNAYVRATHYKKMYITDALFVNNDIVSGFHIDITNNNRKTISTDARGRRVCAVVKNDTGLLITRTVYCANGKCKVYRYSDGVLQSLTYTKGRQDTVTRLHHSNGVEITDERVDKIYYRYDLNGQVIGEELYYQSIPLTRCELINGHIVIERDIGVNGVCREIRTYTAEVPRRLLTTEYCAGTLPQEILDPLT